MLILANCPFCYSRPPRPQANQLYMRASSARAMSPGLNEILLQWSKKNPATKLKDPIPIYGVASVILLQSEMILVPISSFPSLQMGLDCHLQKGGLYHLLTCAFPWLFQLSWPCALTLDLIEFFNTEFIL